MTPRFPSMNSETIVLAKRSRSPSGISSRPCKSIMHTLSRSPAPAVFLYCRTGIAGATVNCPPPIIAGAVGAQVDHDRRARPRP